MGRCFRTTGKKGRHTFPPIDMEPDVHAFLQDHLPFKGSPERQVPSESWWEGSLRKEAAEPDSERHPRGPGLGGKLV